MVAWLVVIRDADDRTFKKQRLGSWWIFTPELTLLTHLHSELIESHAQLKLESFGRGFTKHSESCLLYLNSYSYHSAPNTVEELHSQHLTVQYMSSMFVVSFMNYNSKPVKLECLCVPMFLAFGTVPTHGRHSITSEEFVTIIHVRLDSDDCSPAKLLFIFQWRTYEKKDPFQLPLGWIQKWLQRTRGRAARLVLVQQLLRGRERVASVFLRHCSIPGEWVTPRLCRSFQYLGLNELWNICFIGAWVHFWGLKLCLFWAEHGACTVCSELTGNFPHHFGSLSSWAISISPLRPEIPLLRQGTGERWVCRWFKKKVEKRYCIQHVELRST